ncbi:hypothetical protein [Elongatibacter sediminis]|uniref:Uncharacterized protein n=1 Tax=Elongatibacter sediminis TaxID=3119006 RepID=A0AAW9RBG4_9GAMM
MNRTLNWTLAGAVSLALAGSAQAAGPREGHAPHGAPPGTYGPSAPQHSPYRHPRGYDKHRRHDDNDDFVKVAAGALVLGTIIYAISQNSQKATQAPPPVSGPPAQAPEPAAAPDDYWYRIDGDGRCVLVYLNNEGREVWTDVDPSNCE